MVAQIVGTLLSIPLIYSFMYTFEYGLQGIPIAQFIQSVIVLATTVIYTFCNPEAQKVWQPYDIEVFRGWGEYLSVSAPATLMICAEWWAFEALTVLAGMLSVLELAAQTMCLSMIGVLFMVSVGLQQATGALIGNSIGANNVALANRFFSLTLKITLSLNLVVAVAIVLLRS